MSGRESQHKKRRKGEKDKERQWVYGRRPVVEYLQSQPHGVLKLYIASSSNPGAHNGIIAQAKKHDIPVLPVSAKRLEELIGYVNHQGVAGELKPFEYQSVQEILQVAERRREPGLLVALDQVQDPHNVGAIARSALAFGAHGLLIMRDRACEITPTVTRISAGATAKLPVAKVTNLRNTLASLKEQNYWVVGAMPEGGNASYQVDFAVNTVLVIGSEGKGIRPLIVQSCDILAEIPISTKIGSLNASAAAAVLLYEAARQRIQS